MKKILITTLIILLTTNISEISFAIDDVIQPEPVAKTQKENFWKKFKFHKSKDSKINAEPKKPEQQTVADVFSQNSTYNQDDKNYTVRSIAEIQADEAKRPKAERNADKKAEKKMTAKEKQVALADKINSNVISEEIEASTTIKGGVEENVIVSIDDCIKLALYNNPTIRYAMSNADIYKSKIAQAWSKYFPEFSLDTAYSKNQILKTNFDFPNAKYDLWHAVSVEGSLLLYDFGKTQQEVKIAKKTHEATISDLQTAINDTVYNVKSAYFEYLYALRQKQVMVSTVEKYDKHYKEAKAAYEVGAKAKIDVVTAAYNLSNAKLDLIKAVNQAETTKAQLNNTMGLPAYSNYNVTDNMELQKYKLNFEELIEEAYNLRPELQSVTKKAEASKILITSTKLAFTPDLKGFGSYTLGGRSYTAADGYQLGVKLAYPTTNLLMLKKHLDEAKATHERDLAELDKKRNDVYLDVKTAYIAYMNAKDSVPVAHKAMNEAKLQYEIAAGRYKTGLSSAIELKDAEVTYRNAQLAYYNALMKYNTSIAGVEKTVGSPIKSMENNAVSKDNTPVDINL